MFDHTTSCLRCLIKRHRVYFISYGHPIDDDCVSSLVRVVEGSLIGGGESLGYCVVKGRGMGERCRLSLCSQCSLCLSLCIGLCLASQGHDANWSSSCVSAIYNRNNASISICISSLVVFLDKTVALMVVVRKKGVVLASAVLALT